MCRRQAADWSLVDEGEQAMKKQMLAEAEKVAPIKVRPDETRSAVEIPPFTGVC